MNRKVISSLILVALLTLMSAFVVRPARADLPPAMTWVKNLVPVVSTGQCGVSTPARPAVLFESAGNYMMYFTTHPGSAGAQIYLATTTDGGVSWTCGNSSNPVLTVGTSGAWDSARVINPSAIKDGSTYKMWYTGIDSNAHTAIGYATSTDGIVWNKQGKVLDVSPGAWDSSIVREPSVVKVGSTYHMWYGGTALWPYFQIGHATSEDGVTWVKDAKPVLTPSDGSWDSIETYGPSVVYNTASSQYEMFYSGNSGARWLTGHATSADGVTWTKDGNAIISPSATGWDNNDSTDYVAAVLDSGTWKVFYSGASSSGYQIGLATLTSKAQLTFNPLSTNVQVGQTTDVYIDLNAVTNLYGYQFIVNYNSAKVSAEGEFVDTYFDTTHASIPNPWNAACAAGTCRFAVSKTAPDTAWNGSGSIAKITFTGQSAGLVPLTFSSDILTDIDSRQFDHTTTVAWLQVNSSTAVATVHGFVDMQGRSVRFDDGTVTLYEKYGTFAPQPVNFRASDGYWTATVPVNGASSNYSIVAAHSLYLSNQKTDVALASGADVSMATTRLLGGDANENGQIDVGDLSRIGGVFGNPSTIGVTPDINADGVINILDLVLAGGNLRKVAPQNWQ